MPALPVSDYQEAPLKNAVIAVLLALLIWFGSAIIRLERYHYASMLGLCDQHSGELLRAKRQECLKHTETRTNDAWNLLYGLGIL